MLLTVLLFLLSIAVAYTSFRLSRQFVRDRLRYVDAAQRTSAPWIAGVGALLVGALIVSLLPVLGAGTALTFAFAVGTGVAAGARDVREGRGMLDDGR